MVKRLKWVLHTPSIWAAINDKNEEVGCLHYERVGAHMHWCWYQTFEFRMTPGCSQEMRDKQKELFKTRGKE